MWRKIIDWYEELEREHLAILERPELAAQVAPGYRRKMADSLATMSPIERQQLRDFSLTYRGRRFWLAIAKFALAFTCIGLLMELALDKGSWIAPVVVANLLGFGLLMGGVGVWFNATQSFRNTRRFVVGMLLGVLGAFVGIALGDGRPLVEQMPKLMRMIPFVALIGALAAVPLIVLALYRRRQNAALMEQLQRDAERERLARELSESQLRMLRAQIEPHFLFNTLGAVQQLAADGAPRAAALTADLIAFLRASFSDMRCEQVSLKCEFATIESYLRVMQARMGARLRFEISLPDALAASEVPSMIVLTLVENAIKHGIEPSLRGGEIHVGAAAQDAGIRIWVRDSGVGMSDTPGNGAGLDNVRRRLQLAYGDAARLVLREAEPGLSAELHVPAKKEAA
ncbi:sensor histidine kinase [Massilia sp. LC238]|uniref:sensor histidine kinase n=1 Tax=Massilia sp. LC238 TaxID=1502852 RepID=UPI0004E2A1D9|nr:histidine kinase [Massilia sp. LC238]KFC74483.1 putative signal transduction histidine kinase [Massilia sp. LC238]